MEETQTKKLFDNWFQALKDYLHDYFYSFLIEALNFKEN